MTNSFSRMDKDAPCYGGGNKDNKYTPASTSKYGGKKKANVVQQRLTRGDSDWPTDLPEGVKYHEKFWREELRAVLNQGSSRVCWTMASMGALSARLLIEKKVRSLKYFSQLHLLVGIFDKTKAKGELKDLNDLKEFLEKNGAMLERDCKCVDPLLEMKKKGTNDKSKIPTPILCTHKYQPKPSSVFKVKELVVLSDVNETHLIQLFNKGPVAISIADHYDFARFTGGGIYEGHAEDLISELGYHMVLCTGYGTLNGVHYFEVQNSLGPKWGDKGFGKIIRKISRGKGMPSLIHSVIYPVLLDEYEDEE